MKPSTGRVLRLLQIRAEQGATSLDAWRIASCSRMAARVAELRADGYPIASKYETTDGIRYVRYFLA